MDFAFDNDLDTVTMANAGVKVPLKKLDGSALLNPAKEPVGLIMFGSDGDAYRKASRSMARKRVERAQANAGKTVPDEQIDAAQDDELDLLLACTKGWYGVTDTKGEPIKYTVEAGRQFYQRYPFAREQGNAAVVDRDRFTKASSGA